MAKNYGQQKQKPMKQIPFNHELLNTPGITVKYRDGSQPDFVKVYGNVIRSMDNNGCLHINYLKGKRYNDNANDPHDLLMYRQPRTAEEVAREVWFDCPYLLNTNFPSWQLLSVEQQRVMIALVQAGMDEVKNDTP